MRERERERERTLPQGGEERGIISLLGMPSIFLLGPAYPDGALLVRELYLACFLPSCLAHGVDLVMALAIQKVRGSNCKF